MRKSFALSIATAIFSVAGSSLTFAVDNYATAQFAAIYQSECISSISRIVPQYTLPPNSDNKTYMHVRHMGDPGTAELLYEVSNPVTWDVSQLSGYKPPAPISNWQRGYYDVGLPDGTSAFQLKCHDGGYVINTYQFDHFYPPEGPSGEPADGGPNVTLSRTFNPPKSVWTTPTSELTVQVYYKLPWLLHQSGASGQAVLFVLLQDTRSGIEFFQLAQIYDTRPFGTNNGSEFSAEADGTLFVSSPLVSLTAGGSSPRFITKSPYSQSMQNANTWTSQKFFRYHVKPEDLLEIISEFHDMGLIEMSTTPSDYKVVQVGLLNEVFTGTNNTKQISMGGSFHHLEVYRAY